MATAKEWSVCVVNRLPTQLTFPLWQASGGNPDFQWPIGEIRVLRRAFRIGYAIPSYITNQPTHTTNNPTHTTNNLTHTANNPTHATHKLTQNATTKKPLPTTPPAGNTREHAYPVKRAYDDDPVILATCMCCVRVRVRVRECERLCPDVYGNIFAGVLGEEE